MPTEQQLIGALRQADAAGDTQAAQRFAELIKQGRTNQPVEPESTTPDISGVPEFGTVDGLNALFGSQFGDENTGVGSLLRDAAAQLFTLSPEARLDGFKKRFPELEIQEIGGGNAIITHPDTGGVNVLNAKSFSNADIAPFIGAAAASFPAAKVIQVPASLGAKALAGAGAAGATDIALQGAEQLQGSDQDIDFARTGLSAATGGALPAAPAVVRAASERIGVKKLMDKAIPSVESIKDRARVIYQEIDDIGGSLDQTFVSNTLNKLNTKLGKEVLPEMQPAQVKKLLDVLESRQGSTLSFTDFDAIRKTAGSLSKSLDDNERRLGRIVMDQLDDSFEAALAKVPKGTGVSDKFRQARSLWKRAKKGEILEAAFEKASNQASGMENGIRVQFRSILNNKRSRKNFSPSELAAMQKVVRGGKAENIFKALGKFGFTEGQASTMLLGSLGIAGGAAVAGSAGAVAIPLAGQLSKQIAQKLTRNNAALADRLIKVGPDSKEIAKAYFRLTPKASRSSEELAELLMLRGANLETMKAAAKGLPKGSQQLLEDAALIASGQNVSANVM